MPPPSDFNAKMIEIQAQVSRSRQSLIFFSREPGWDEAVPIDSPKDFKGLKAEALRLGL